MVVNLKIQSYKFLVYILQLLVSEFVFIGN